MCDCFAGTNAQRDTGDLHSKWDHSPESPWPSNDVCKDWYDAAILCDENHIANCALQSTL